MKNTNRTNFRPFLSTLYSFRSLTFFLLPHELLLHCSLPLPLLLLLLILLHNACSLSTTSLVCLHMTISPAVTTFSHHCHTPTYRKINISHLSFLMTTEQQTILSSLYLIQQLLLININVTTKLRTIFQTAYLFLFMTQLSWGNKNHRQPVTLQNKAA